MPDRKVAIVLGSESDLETMSPALEQLGKLGIPVDVQVLSAHRSPDAAAAFAEQAEANGIAVIIAGAGKAAHLAGVLAAKTILPVIGVPIETSLAGGLDSLLSMVQMPRGVPVATVAINGARNAAILAAKILRVGGLVGPAGGPEGGGAHGGGAPSGPAESGGAPSGPVEGGAL